MVLAIVLTALSVLLFVLGVRRFRANAMVEGVLLTFSAVFVVIAAASWWWAALSA